MKRGRRKIQGNEENEEEKEEERKTGGNKMTGSILCVKSRVKNWKREKEREKEGCFQK